MLKTSKLKNLTKFEKKNSSFSLKPRCLKFEKRKEKWKVGMSGLDPIKTILKKLHFFIDFFINST